MGCLLLLFLGSFLLAESPVWLILHGHEKQAIDALIFYDRSDHEVTMEMEILRTMAANNETEDNETVRQKIGRHLDLFRDPTFIRPLAFLMVMFGLMEWSSFPFLEFYMISMFKVKYILRNDM